MCRWDPTGGGCPLIGAPSPYDIKSGRPAELSTLPLGRSLTLSWLSTRTSEEKAAVLGVGLSGLGLTDGSVCLASTSMGARPRASRPVAPPHQACRAFQRRRSYKQNTDSQIVQSRLHQDPSFAPCCFRHRWKWRFRSSRSSRVLDLAMYACSALTPTFGCLAVLSAPRLREHDSDEHSLLCKRLNRQTNILNMKNDKETTRSTTNKENTIHKQKLDKKYPLLCEDFQALSLRMQQLAEGAQG